MRTECGFTLVTIIFPTPSRPYKYWGKLPLKGRQPWWPMLLVRNNNHRWRRHSCSGRWETKALSVGELANLTQEKMRKRRQSPTCVSRIAPCKTWFLQSMVKILQWWCSKDYKDDQNVTQSITKILQWWCSKYYSDDQNITQSIVRILQWWCSRYYFHELEMWGSRHKEK